MIRVIGAGLAGCEAAWYLARHGEEVELEFAAWLRPMRKFDDIDELIATVMGNIQWVRDNL